MTYSKQVREYCENNKGTIIDISKVKDEEFAEIPYKTLLKILNRLEEEKIVTSVSQGAYSIGKPTVCSQPNVLKQYVGNGKGMVVGYLLYNSSGISNYHPFSVVTMLEKQLNEKGISNNCRDIYCNIHGRKTTVF